MSEFTSWESELYHHGIKGMKWGVRRYQNADGSLTAAGQKRYGDSPTKSTSARKMQRDINNLDKAYANARARENRANYVGRNLSAKMIKKGKKPEELTREFLEQKTHYSKKLRTAAEKAVQANKDIVAIRKMQVRILDRAEKMGYTVSSKEVTRYGTTGGDYAAHIIGGLIGQIAYQIATKGSGQVVVRGNKVKIRNPKA